MSDRNQQPGARRPIAPLWEVLLFAIILAVLAQLDLDADTTAASRLATMPVAPTYTAAHDSLPAHLALGLAGDAEPSTTSGS